MSINRIQKRIIGEAINTFKLYGIKYTRVDTIATKLHISKRTLYDYFSSKEDLLLNCLLFEINKIKRNFLEMEIDYESSLELIVRLDEMIFLEVLSYCPAFYQDIRICRNAQNIINEQFKLWIQSTFLSICNEAISEGTITQNCKSQFLLSFLENNLRASYSSHQQQLKDVKDIHKYTTLTYLTGICTEYGRELLETIEKGNYNENNL